MSKEPEATENPLQVALQPFHAAQGKLLTAVLQDEVDEAESVLLVFGSECLTFQCHPDQDVVTLSFGAATPSEDADDLTGSRAWSRFIGKEFFWGWLTVNQRGATDGVLLSFDGVVPEIGLNVVAASFETLEVRQRAG
ncbi:MAG: DUF6334 family protein [Janthinobacterium lividum]